MYACVCMHYGATPRMDTRQVLWLRAYFNNKKQFIVLATQRVLGRRKK